MRCRHRNLGVLDDGVTGVWENVDGYVTDRLVGADPVLEAALADSAAAGLPPIQVSAPQGKFLRLLAQISGARRILEIGTLGGYSTIWLARGLAAGRPARSPSRSTPSMPRWPGPTSPGPASPASSRSASARRCETLPT